MKKLSILLAGIVLTNLSVAQADQTLVDLAKKVKPAVVLIQTFDKDNKPLGQGSGFFINNKGHIVTNHHVLEGAYRATVKTSSGMEYPVEGIIAKNADADIVKLVVNIPDANITFLNLSESVPSEGQDIVVIGNPLGLESTVSAGIVSAVRDIPAFGIILQITAPVSSGSSGSPVVNMKGEVIGIATFIFKQGQNLNFAIPSSKIVALKETTQTPVFNTMTTDSNDAQLFYRKGMNEIWQNNWANALIYFKKITEISPMDADACFFTAYCYDMLHRYDEAITTYNQTIRINPEISIAHLFLGIAYDKLGRYQDAIESFKQAIRIKPDDANAHRCLGASYGQLGLYEQAVEESKQAIRIKSDDAGAHYNLGMAYLGLGDKGAALDEYKILKLLDAERANKLFNLIYE